LARLQDPERKSSAIDLRTRCCFSSRYVIFVLTR
jgi:hypothetical protein